MSTTTATVKGRSRFSLGWRELSEMRRREAIRGYLFISPWIIGLVLFTLGPFVTSFVLSFTNYSILQPGRWVGLGNYVEAFTKDPLFWLSMGNTVYYALSSTVVRIVLGFALALLLNAKVRGLTIWRTLFYVPSIIPIVATTMIWSFILNPRFGLLNYFLSFFGVERIRWLQSPEWAKPALVIMSVWWVGGNMVIFLAGLQGIPEEYYEAAKIDGASALRRLLRITIPLMTPTIFFNLLINIINTFQVFTQALIMTNGGPLNSTRFFMLHLYENAFVYSPAKMGYASALAWILFLIIFALALAMVKTSNRWVFYGN